MTDTVQHLPAEDLVDVDRELETKLPEPASVLPSERLNRLAELAATALKVAGPAGAEVVALDRQPGRLHLLDQRRYLGGEASGAVAALEHPQQISALFSRCLTSMPSGRRSGS